MTVQLPQHRLILLGFCKSNQSKYDYAMGKKDHKKPDLLLMKCIVLAGITAGIGITEIKHSIIFVKSNAKKIKEKIKKRIRG